MARTRSSPVRLTAALLALALPFQAFSQEIPAGETYPIDIELVRPVLSKDGMFAADSPRDGRRGTWVFSSTFQYERSPLRVFVYDNLVGRVISHRNTLQLGFLTAASDRVALGVSIPVSVHLGGDLNRLDNDGAGFGDLAGTLRWRAGSWGPVSLGLAGTVLLPTGAEERWMGEDGVRARIGAMTMIQGDGTDLVADLGLHLRAPVETEFAFTAGSEIDATVGLRRRLFDDLDVHVEWVNRLGIAVGQFGGRWSSEVLGGIRYRATEKVRLDLGVGRGINAGYGTSGFRVLLGFAFVNVPPEPPPVVEPEPTVTVTVLPEEADRENEVAVVPAPPSRVRIEGDQIAIDDEIRFIVDTATLLPESMPVIQLVADLMNSEPIIGHLVVEGHASQEGTYEYNHKLSDSRAEAIFQALILDGVHPSRLSYRGMGEVESATEGEDEASLAPNRRVQFKIVKQYLPGESIPVLNPEIRLPWNGERFTVKVPTFPDNKVPDPKGGELKLDDEEGTP